MPYEINETHDPKLESWVESANDPETDFPIQNLPFCAWADAGSDDQHLGVLIGKSVLDVAQLAQRNLLGQFSDRIKPDAVDPRFALADLDADSRNELRSRLIELLMTDGGHASKLASALFNQSDVRFSSVFRTRDYTDFYASLFHATSVGSMFRPDNPILPNYKHIPIAYHGRASTIVASGTEIRRPCGQILPGATIADGDPVFGPCKLLDYELEVGFFVGKGNEDENGSGQPISIDDAEDHIFGLCLVNDWSARDMQKWEYQPLGPFLAKSFATTISPYIVTMEALAPFRTPALERADGDPKPLSYLTSERNSAMGGVDITLEVYLQSEQMRKRGLSPMRLSRGRFKDMYWTIGQMLTHHASNGCLMQPGDLLASGTVSGPTRGARGCLLELTWDGDPFADEPIIVPGSQRTPIELPTGETRTFLADGDEVILKGFCEREGFRRIGFGECRGRITPARSERRFS
ncbi:MAG: fumarylacetoacetase [Planctomycetes bacterium]|nr:fumarylacetoacetase [Planctomycetota bacterium]